MGRITVRLNENRDYSVTLPEFTEKKRFYNALSALSPHSRQALVLYYLEGYSINEIAQSLNVSKRAVYGRLSRGKDKMRKVLEKF